MNRTVGSSVLRLDRLTIAGRSSGGRQTWFKVQPPKVAFDVGHGPEDLTGVKAVFLSHGHLDHAAGVPIILSQRALHGLGALDVYSPRPITKTLDEFIAAAAALEQSSYDYRSHALDAGDEVALPGGFLVRAFATSHVVPSLGFHLVELVDRLKSRYRNLSGPEIARHRRRGDEVSRREERLLISYLGDTESSVFSTEPAVFSARVLMAECTFLASEHRDRARRYGHLHLDDIVAAHDRFENELIVLHHLSRRSSPAALRRALEERVPLLAPRIVIAGESDDE